MGKKSANGQQELLTLYEKSQREANRTAIMKYLAMTAGGAVTGGLLGVLASRMHPMLKKPGITTGLGITGGTVGLGIGNMAGTSILNARAAEQARDAAKLLKKLSTSEYKESTQEVSE